MKVERGNESRMRLKEKGRLAICYSHPDERRKVTECSQGRKSMLKNGFRANES